MMSLMFTEVYLKSKVHKFEYVYYLVTSSDEHFEVLDLSKSIDFGAFGNGLQHLYDGYVNVHETHLTIAEAESRLQTHKNSGIKCVVLGERSSSLAFYRNFTVILDFVRGPYSINFEHLTLDGKRFIESQFSESTKAFALVVAKLRDKAKQVNEMSLHDFTLLLPVDDMDLMKFSVSNMTNQWFDKLTIDYSTSELELFNMAIDLGKNHTYKSSLYIVSSCELAKEVFSDLTQEPPLNSLSVIGRIMNKSKLKEKILT